MAEAIVQKFKGPVRQPHKVSSIELVPGGGGVFDVEVDGDLVFSKHAVGRHADVREVVDLIATRLST